jgi:hypothetical protein
MTIHLERPRATPPICPVAPGLVRFGGVIMLSDAAHRTADLLLLACGVADDTPAAPCARRILPDRIAVSLYGRSEPLTLDEAMLLLGELHQAIEAHDAR